MKQVAITIIAISLLIPTMMPALPSARGTSTIWSANFETGSHSQFNQCWVQSVGATVGVSTSIVHSGKYAEIANYNGQDNSGAPHRAYCGQGFSLSNQYSNVENDIWIYVPAIVNGKAQNYQSWFTFVNLFFKDPTGLVNGPLLVMGCGASNCNQRQLILRSGPFTSNNFVVSQNTVNWPLNQWFELRTIIRQTSIMSVITLYEVSAVGVQQLVVNMTSATTGLYLYQAHWGLYDGPPSGVSAIYNDDITLMELGAAEFTTTAAAMSAKSSTISLTSALTSSTVTASSSASMTTTSMAVTLTSYTTSMTLASTTSITSINSTVVASTTNSTLTTQS